MIFDTFSEVLLSVVFSFAYGFLFGAVYRSISTIFYSVKRVILLEIYVLKAISITEYRSFKRINSANQNHIEQNIYDFTFFLIFGALYVIVCYLVSDGVFRFYLFAITALAFILSLKTVGMVSDKIIYHILYFIYSSSFALLFILSFPIKALFARLKTPIANFFSAVLEKFKSWPAKLLPKPMKAKKEKNNATDVC